jgi:hypothetical protein
MTLLLELPPDMEARLQAAATAHGVAPAEYTLQILDTQLPALSAAAEATRTLLRSWREEDAADDPEQAEVEVAELKAALNDPRLAAGAQPLFP